MRQETIYAVGDIHGCAKALESVLDAIAADAAGRVRPRVVTLGDYVDRGDDSKGVLDLLIGRAKEDFDLVSLLGNHETFLIDALKGRSDAQTLQSWILYAGGAETLESYGVDLRRNGVEGAMAEMRRRIPKAHMDFLKDLHLSHSEEDLFFSHAGADPEHSLEDQSFEDLVHGCHDLFEYDGEWTEDRVLAAWGRRVVHGHWAQKGGFVEWAHRVGIDCGAGYLGGTLAAAAFDPDGIVRRLRAADKTPRIS